MRQGSVCVFYEGKGKGDGEIGGGGWGVSQIVYMLISHLTVLVPSYLYIEC